MELHSSVNASLIDRFLYKMLPGWPEHYSEYEQKVLAIDTKIEEIEKFAPELLR